MDTTSVLIVDDDRDSRAAIVHALASLGHPLAEVESGEEALEFAERERPAIAIVEVLLPATSGYEVCRALKDRYGRDLPVIFVSGRRTHPADLVAGLLIGADDYVPKPIRPDELRARVRRLLEGAPADGSRTALTPREEQVLRLMADGLSHAQIADRLVITSRTVAKHVERILSKLRVHTRAQAVALALREGLVD